MEVFSAGGGECITRAVDFFRVGLPTLPLSFGVSMKSGSAELTLLISLSCFCISSILRMGDLSPVAAVDCVADSVSILSCELFRDWFPLTLLSVALVLVLESRGDRRVGSCMDMLE